MANPRPVEVLRTFLDRLGDPEHRDTVEELFTPAAIITRPGMRFEGPNAIGRYLSTSAARFESVDKEYRRWMESGTEAISTGTLYGTMADGTEFSDIRYVDIATVDGRRITRLDVYNDLHAEGLL